MRVLVPEAAGGRNKGGDVNGGLRGELKAKPSAGIGELFYRFLPTDGEGTFLEVLNAVFE
jgi:hypothetical protein